MDVLGVRFRSGQVKSQAQNRLIVVTDEDLEGRAVMRLPCAATEPLKLGFWVPLPCSPRAPLSRPRESSPTGIAAAYESAGIVPLFPLQVPNLALHGIDGAAARSLANYRG